MKCKKCGAELKAGNVYCSSCGAEIQIVPDYNALDDDISNGWQGSEMLKSQQALRKEAPVKKANNQKKTPEPVSKKNETTDGKKKALIAVSCILVVLALVLGISVFVSNNKKQNSFAYQYERAEEYKKNELPDKALECIDKALDLKRDDEDALLLKAEILGDLEKQKEQIQTLLHITELYPKQEKAYRMLVDIYVQNQDYSAMQKLAQGVTDKKILTLFDGYIPETPVFKKEPGEYDTRIQLELTSDANSQILYTVDGSDPIAKGKNYTGEIELDEGKTLVKAVATNEFGIFSEVIEGEFIIELLVPDKPQASLPSGTYTEEKKISITVQDGCTAYYTWDGSTPNASSTRYSGSFSMKEGNNVLSVIVINKNNQMSDVARYNYIYYPPQNDEEEE